jgi:hypothetical protein
MPERAYSQPTDPLSTKARRHPICSRSADVKLSVGSAKAQSNAFLSNVRIARSLWGSLSKIARKSLLELTQNYGLSVAAGDLLMLEGRWYVTHAGLLRFGHRRRCSGIHAILQKELSDPALSRWVFKAVVYKSPSSKGFVGYGDADPSNVSTLVHGAEMRIAETRAVNRALRKAYGIGLCSVEELGSFSSNPGNKRDHEGSAKHSSNGSNNGPPRLRDQLCLLIRQHNLDPTLVKAYAADFCGTPSLKEANRDLVQSFISHLTACAKENRDMLICRLNSYAQPVAEVKQ